MAGIGIQLNKIFNKHTVATSIYGIGFSLTYTIAPLFTVTTFARMYKVLGFESII